MTQKESLKDMGLFSLPKAKGGSVSCSQLAGERL